MFLGPMFLFLRLCLSIVALSSSDIFRGRRWGFQFFSIKVFSSVVFCGVGELRQKLKKGGAQQRDPFFSGVDRTPMVTGHKETKERTQLDVRSFLR